MQLGLFVFAFLILFLVSQFLTRELGSFFMRVTKSQTMSIYLLALLFFPGVLIHELGHFLMASFLLVRTGEIEFLPKIQEGGIKLGSVSIAHTDPLRRFVIGVAPFVSGLAILFLSAYYLTPLWPFSWKTILFGYILFEIGNTMFSSKKDLEGAIGLLLFVGFIVGSLFVLGTRLPENIIYALVAFSHWELFSQMSMWIAASGIVNICVWVMLKIADRR